ncbi:hypothetical protein [Peribacillus frigoritolerans]
MRYMRSSMSLQKYSQSFLNNCNHPLKEPAIQSLEWRRFSLEKSLP